MKKIKKDKMILLLIFTSIYSAFSQNDTTTTITYKDSVRVYVMVDNFERKGSTYKFITTNKIVVIKFDKSKWLISFFIPLDTSKGDGFPLKLLLYKKNRFNKNYRRIYTSAHYVTGKKYFIFYKNKRLKKKYHFSELWTNAPNRYFIHIEKLFFLDPDKFLKKPDSIQYIKTNI